MSGDNAGGMCSVLLDFRGGKGRHDWLPQRRHELGLVCGKQEQEEEEESLEDIETEAERVPDNRLRTRSLHEVVEDRRRLRLCFALSIFEFERKPNSILLRPECYNHKTDDVRN